MNRPTQKGSLWPPCNYKKTGGQKRGSGLFHKLWLGKRQDERLLGFSGVMLLAVDIGVVFGALQVSDDFGGHLQFGRKALLQNCCKTMGVVDRGQVREQ